MNKLKMFLFGLLLATGLASCTRQDGTAKILINEVLTNNVTNFQDDYGIHSAWIEVFNKSYNSVNLAGYFLKVSNQPGDTITYIVPKGDVLTKVSPRQHALFWADGKPNRGTFHTNFTLNTTQPCWVGLYDSGKKLLDEIVVPVLNADESYARVQDASKDWEIKSGSETKYVTPSTNNQTIERNEKVEKFEVHDSSGIGMSLTAMLVVFCGLILLYIFFRILGKAVFNKSKPVKQPVNMKQEENTNKNAEEVFAAIAMALHEELGGVHDIESNKLTIRRVHTPWSDKYNALRVIPRKNS